MERIGKKLAEEVSKIDSQMAALAKLKQHIFPIENPPGVFLV